MNNMNLSNIRTPAGTRRQMITIADVAVGANVVCVRSGGAATRGKEYTVTAVSSQRIDYEGNGRKGSMKPLDFLQLFERRLGPVVEGSVRRGLMAKAIMDGKTYCAGDVITLTEAGGRVYDFKNNQGRKGSVEHQELLTCFLYI